MVEDANWKERTPCESGYWQVFFLPGNKRLLQQPDRKSHDGARTG